MRKKKPVLVGNICEEMEKLRQAIEVLTGERVSFVCLDFNTCSGEILFGGSAKVKVCYIHNHKELMSFRLGSGGWCIATFDHDDGNLRVSSEHQPNIRKTTTGEVAMRWVGSSNRSRYEEPLFPYKHEYTGEVRTTTLSELINSKP